MEEDSVLEEEEDADDNDEQKTADNDNDCLLNTGVSSPQSFLAMFDDMAQKKRMDNSGGD